MTRQSQDQKEKVKRKKTVMICELNFQIIGVKFLPCNGALLGQAYLVG